MTDLDAIAKRAAEAKSHAATRYVAAEECARIVPALAVDVEALLGRVRETEAELVRVTKRVQELEAQTSRDVQANLNITATNQKLMKRLEAANGILEHLTNTAVMEALTKLSWEGSSINYPVRLAVQKLEVWEGRRERAQS